MSGIYIPGMEMPKNCDCCDFMTVEGEYGEPICPFGRIIRCASEMHPDCPLVPVPEFSDIGSDPDDVWKKIFSLVVLLLSDREKFDKLKDDVLADLEVME